MMIFMGVSLLVWGKAHGLRASRRGRGGGLASQLRFATQAALYCARV